jgi:signal transduction histidine kinase
VFKNLRTSTKLIILCSTFIVAIGVTAYGLVVEKRIAIDFARKERVGNRYLATLRETYAAILTIGTRSASADETVAALSAAGADADGVLQTAELRRALTEALRDLSAKKAEGGNTDALVLDALGKGRDLAARIGDDSNLALDPDLDSYYLQDVVVAKFPAFLGHLGEMHTLFHGTAPAGAGAHEPRVRFLVLDGLVRSIVDAMTRNLAAAYRGNADGSLRQSIDAEFATVISQTESYLGKLNASTSGSEARNVDAALDDLHAATVKNAIKAWAAGQAELDRLLQQRLDGLVGKMSLSLGLIGALAALSILIAIMTHRHIVRPLERLEHTASTVRETKNYSLRIEHGSRDEIGRLAVAFNDMLSELDAAREREMSKQAELARVERLTTMGEMAASIAHEINQPLAAIVASSNAGLRWLSRTTPDLDEARLVLQRIANDGHRASQVIGSVRAMCKKDLPEKAPIDVNDLVREVLALVHGDMKNRRIAVQVALSDRLPLVPADHVQLQQVLMNLVTNAADAMRGVTGRPRLLRVSSEAHEPDAVLIRVEDSGIGIAPESRERIFDAFFTTKANGMGLGLSICRSIVEAHGGRLSASPGTSHGSVFQVVLPAHAPGGVS